MQEIIRAIIEAAPSWAAGLALVALARRVFSHLFWRVFGYLTRGQEARQARANAQIEQLPKNLSAEERSAEITRAFDETGAKPFYGVAMLMAVLATYGLQLWVYVSVWSVVSASAPGVLGASIWWVGVALATVEMAWAAHSVRKKWAEDGKELPRYAGVFGILGPLLIAAVVYGLAPVGVLVYTVSIVLFSRLEGAIWRRYEGPGSTPTVLMFL